MDIEKILDEPDHKVYLFITWNGVYFHEWIKNAHGNGIIRITYDRKPEITDKIYYMESDK